MTIDRETVMQVLRDRAPRAMRLGEVCEQVGVPKRKREHVLEVLEELAELGLAQEKPGHRFRLAERSEPRRQGFGRGPAAAGMPRDVTDVERGRITIHPRGFAFVATESSGPDVFIPPDAIGGALHSDYVAVQAHRTQKGREGRVVEVLGRGLTKVTGTVQRRGRSLWLEPDDPRMRGPMPLRGNVPRAAHDDVSVIASFVQYPEYNDELPEVRFEEILGQHGMLKVEVDKILIREGVVERFGPQARDEEHALPSRVSAREREGREDLRGYDLVTIDPEDARDHDDAVWAKQTKDGGFRLIVAIADVAHYVQQGNALDREAFARGCSIYLPDRAIPMLPAQLSGDLASLVAGRDRLCLAVQIDLGPNGAVRGHRLIEGVMRSRGALTYPGVARALELTEEAPEQKEANQQREMLKVLLAAARTLRKRRLRRGALDFDLPEAKIVLDEAESEPLDSVRQRKDPGIREAYRIIEEMMILANEVVAQALSAKGVPTIYRVHGLPDEEKIEIFAQLASALGYGITTEDAMQPRKLAKFLRRLEGSPHAPVLSYLLLRAMQQATYDTTNIGHFGLASKEYLHFTSPIRRYPDLVVHRIVRRIVRGHPVDSSARPELRRAAAESSRLERRAMTVERDVVECYRAAVMQDRIGDQLDATISHVAEHGFYCTLDSPFVETHTPVERLDEDYFQLDSLGVQLVGRKSGATYALGDRLRLRIEDVSLQRREVVALPVARIERDDSGEIPSRAKKRATEKQSTKAKKRAADKRAKKENRPTEKQRAKAKSHRKKTDDDRPQSQGRGRKRRRSRRS